jgi:predicted phosphodiesterase
MELQTLHYDYEPGDCFSLEFFGDQHRTHVNCSKSHLAKEVKRIVENPKSLVVLMGDLHDCITVKDKRFDSEAIDYTIVPKGEVSKLLPVIKRDAAQFVAPFVDHLIVVHDGNHENELNKACSDDVTAEWLEKLGGEALVRKLHAPGMATTTLVFNDAHGHACQVKLNTAHGTLMSQYAGTILNALIRKVKDHRDVDIVARGHSHHLIAAKVTTLDDVKDELIDHNVVVVSSGSALKTYTSGSVSYAERKDYAPVPLGYPRVLLYPSRSGVWMEAVS